MAGLVEIPLSELTHDNFDEEHRIGGGGFSVVYKGTYHGAKVAALTLCVFCPRSTSTTLFTGTVLTKMFWLFAGCHQALV